MTRTIVALLIPAALLLGACSSESTSTVTEVSATTQEAEAAATDLPTVADLCAGLLQYANSAEARAQQSGEPFDRTKALESLFDQSALTPEWKDAPQERKDQMVKAYDAAKSGAC
ncbi:hypothetical protein [Rhodococcus tibetensis]|uniref:Lipoprotein n=1 Tax=Rhodococcus tibetensis TaxID=2965064 RepID=A0ABT1Q9H7_9NOCA|nr:hypothetical protein [Rhodococcus sp. FXJ9.536]MCQ4117820.1 hypothetical protein [Rhodococcus sp. FXJ9.536]